LAFDKVIPSQIQEYKIYNVNSGDELIKEASDVDFPPGFVYDADFLYMWVRIVSAGEYYGPNKNGDYFPEDELKAYWETFSEAHPFKNHENKNVENAIGKIITCRWNDVMKCVEILKAIDKKRAPEIVRGYQKGYLTDVSMGCKVPYTLCSICGNKARRRSEFCQHVKYHRMQFLGNGERVFEINYKPKFHDSSTVLSGAERVAKAFFIIDTPPENFIQSSFRKAASNGKTTHYVRSGEIALEKIAGNETDIHPLLKTSANKDQMPKIATSSPMLQKLAELEKELTGKLLNIATSPTDNRPQLNQMLEIIKFLTEKRLDTESLQNIARSVKGVANENGVPVTRAFTTLIGVAELMGIEFFPQELHTILTALTDAELNSDLNSGVVTTEPLFPREFANGLNRSVKVTSPARDFEDPSSILSLYDEAAHRTDEFTSNPFKFLEGIEDGTEYDEVAPVNMVRVVRKVLSPMIPSRSYHPEHLLPRISVVLKGHRPVIGGEEVRRDFNMISNPTTPGDLLGALAYRLYERSRPKLIRTRLIKVASEIDSPLEKTALMPAKGVQKKPGLGPVKMGMIAFPAAYAASAFQKNREENGRYLTDAENFIADKPGIIAGGAILAGVPLTRKIGGAGRKVKEAFTAPFRKSASNEMFEGLTKLADALPSGEFNVFEGKEVLARYMKETGATSKQASAVKMATLFDFGGMEKESSEIMDYYHVPSHEKGRFLKIAAAYLEEELEKAADEFSENMLLSVIGDTSPLARTLPGRAVDAFLFKKLGDMLEPKENKQLKSGPDIETPISKSTSPFGTVKGEGY
jgi:hypothetical protein